MNSEFKLFPCLTLSILPCFGAKPSTTCLSRPSGVLESELQIWIFKNIFFTSAAGFVCLNIGQWRGERDHEFIFSKCSFSYKMGPKNMSDCNQWYNSCLCLFLIIWRIICFAWLPPWPLQAYRAGIVARRSCRHSVGRDGRCWRGQRDAKTERGKKEAIELSTTSALGIYGLTPDRRRMDCFTAEHELHTMSDDESRETSC